MEDFKKFSTMKAEPSTASGGTEQDAAHSFEKGVDIICEECKSEKVIHYANDKYFCSGCFAKEYTRLRSELQQEREDLKFCMQILKSAYYSEALWVNEFDWKRIESLIKKAKLNN